MKHLYSLALGCLASFCAFTFFEAIFAPTAPTQQEASLTAKKSLKFGSGSLDDDCNWVAVSVSEKSYGQCFDNPVEQSYGPPSAYALSMPRSSAAAVDETLCSQFSKLDSVDLDGAKRLDGHDVRWVCPIQMTEET